MEIYKVMSGHCFLVLGFFLNDRALLKNKTHSTNNIDQQKWSGVGREYEWKMCLNKMHKWFWCAPLPLTPLIENYLFRFHDTQNDRCTNGKFCLINFWPVIICYDFITKILVNHHAFWNTYVHLPYVQKFYFYLY